MSTPRIFKVKRLAAIDKTKYREGDFFYTSQSLVILLNNDFYHFASKEDLKKVKKEGKKND